MASMLSNCSSHALHPTAYATTQQLLGYSMTLYHWLSTIPRLLQKWEDHAFSFSEAYTVTKEFKLLAVTLDKSTVLWLAAAARSTCSYH